MEFPLLSSGKTRRELSSRSKWTGKVAARVEFVQPGNLAETQNRSAITVL